MSKIINYTQDLVFIILNYYGHADTIRCVASVLLNFDANIYLIDNSNNENEEDILKNEFSLNNYVHLIFPKENLGFAAGNNLGIKTAIDDGYTKFFLLNNDAVITNRAKSHILRAIQENPSSLISMVIDWGGKNVGFKYYNPYLSLLSDEKKKKNWISYFTGCALIFDINLINSIGFLDDRFFMYGEDIDYSFRAKAMGLPLILIDKKLITHEGSRSSMVSSFFYEYHINRGHILLVRSLGSSMTNKILMYLGRLVLLSVKGVIRSFRYKSLNPLYGVLLAWFTLKIRPNK